MFLVADLLERRFPMDEVLRQLRVAQGEPRLHHIAVAIAQTVHRTERLSRMAESAAPMPSVELDAIRADARVQVGTEGLLLLLQGCVAKPPLCSLLYDPTINFLGVLPLIRVLAPAIRAHQSMQGMLKASQPT
jgi:hypothetical protein